jgi:hypothetical protein
MQMSKILLITLLIITSIESFVIILLLLSTRSLLKPYISHRPQGLTIWIYFLSLQMLLDYFLTPADLARIVYACTKDSHGVQKSQRFSIMLVLNATSL